MQEKGKFKDVQKHRFSQEDYNKYNEKACKSILSKIRNLEGVQVEEDYKADIHVYSENKQVCYIEAEWRRNIEEDLSKVSIMFYGRKEKQFTYEKPDFWVITNGERYAMIEISKIKELGRKDVEEFFQGYNERGEKETVKEIVYRIPRNMMKETVDIGEEIKKYYINIMNVIMEVIYGCKEMYTVSNVKEKELKEIIEIVNRVFKEREKGDKEIIKEVYRAVFGEKYADISKVEGIEEKGRKIREEINGVAEKRRNYEKMCKEQEQLIAS